MEGAWSSYRGGSQFKGGNGHATEVVSLRLVGWLCCLMTYGLSKDIQCHV